MKYAVVDIGSNTIRMNIYLLDGEGKPYSVLSKKVVAGLASYVEEGYMTKKGADKLIRILQSFISLSSSLGLDETIIFATASLRNTKNSQEVLHYVEEATPAQIKLISGEDEAHYGYLGIREDYDIQDGYIVDIGGGSTEITLVEKGQIQPHLR